MDVFVWAKQGVYGWYLLMMDGWMKHGLYTLTLFGCFGDGPWNLMLLPNLRYPYPLHRVCDLLLENSIGIMIGKRQEDIIEIVRLNIFKVHLLTV